MSLNLSDFAFGLNCLRPNVASIEGCYVLCKQGKERDEIPNVKQWLRACSGNIERVEYEINHTHVMDLCLGLGGTYTRDNIKTMVEVYMALLRDELRMKYPEVSFCVELYGDINDLNCIDQAYVTFKSVRQ